MSDQHCSFYKKGKSGFFSSKEPDKCAVIGTTIPEMRVTKNCCGDFFECDIFKEEMMKKGGK